MITDQEVTMLGESLVDALTPEQKQLLLKSIIGKLTSSVREDPRQAQVPTPVVHNVDGQPLPLPKHMSAETARKLAAARQTQVNAELTRSQGVPRDMAQNIARDQAKQAAAVPKVEAPKKVLNKPADIVANREQIEAEQRAAEEAARLEAEEEARIERLLAKREAERSAKVTAAAEKPVQPVRVKSLAEATGTPARKDEIAAASFAKHSQEKPSAMFVVEPTLNDEKHTLPPAKTQSDIIAESPCPTELKEPQPPGFRPFDLVKTQLVAFCNNPNMKNGADVIRRFVFDMKDMPTVPVANALLVQFNPIYVLGRHLDASTTKYIVGFAHPSEASLAGAVNYLKDVATLWSEGGEFPMGASPGSAKRDLSKVRTGDQEGMLVAPAMQAYEHHPKVYVFRPYDDEHQIAIVIA